jgi:site-specific DNA recombinase
MVQMLAVFAEFERAMIIDRAVAGMERKAARGGWTSGSYPFGYTLDAATGFLAPRADEAPLVPVIFELYAKRRLGARAVSVWLNQRGHRTRKGVPWSTNAVLTVLRNRAYRGEVCFRDVYHPAPHPSLVDSELFMTAQTVLQERGEDWSLRASNPSEYLLAGLVVCHRCQHRYVGGAARGRSARYRYYTCWTRHHYGPEHCNADRLPAPDLEAAVLASLRRTYAQRDLLAKALATWWADAKASRPRYEEQLVQVSQEIAKAEDAIERYLLAFEARTLSETQCGQRLSALTEKVAEFAPAPRGADVCDRRGPCWP